MPIVLDDKVRSLFADPASKKVLSTVGEDGVPHTVFKGSMAVDSDGNIRFNEIIESSLTYKNLTYSLWFNRPVSINIIGEDKTSFEIIGKPIRTLICGDEFEEAYVKMLELLGNEGDLAAVWIIVPEKIRENTFKKRLHEHNTNYPLIGHLDKYLKEST
jgi:hypothetical protein